MLQRIQTIYLLLVAIVSSGLIFVFNLWKNEDELVLSIALLAIITIFKFKDRKSQFVLGRLNIILNLILLGFFVYQSLNLSGETMVSEKGIGMLLPFVSIVLLVLANKAIKKDEDLVKSVDRLR